jgi:hypothetical protein
MRTVLAFMGAAMFFFYFVPIGAWCAGEWAKLLTPAQPRAPQEEETK